MNQYTLHATLAELVGQKGTAVKVGRKFITFVDVENSTSCCYSKEDIIKLLVKDRNYKHNSMIPPSCEPCAPPITIVGENIPMVKCGVKCRVYKWASYLSFWWHHLRFEDALSLLFALGMVIGAAHLVYAIIVLPRIC